VVLCRSVQGSKCYVTQLLPDVPQGGPVQFKSERWWYICTFRPLTLSLFQDLQGVAGYLFEKILKLAEVWVSDHTMFVKVDDLSSPKKQALLNTFAAEFSRIFEIQEGILWIPYKVVQDGRDVALLITPYDCRDMLAPYHCVQNMPCNIHPMFDLETLRRIHELVQDGDHEDYDPNMFGTENAHLEEASVATPTENGSQKESVAQEGAKGTKRKRDESEDKASKRPCEDSTNLKPPNLQPPNLLQ